MRAAALVGTFTVGLSGYVYLVLQMVRRSCQQVRELEAQIRKEQVDG